MQATVSVPQLDLYTIYVAASLWASANRDDPNYGQVRDALDRLAQISGVVGK